MQMVTMVPDRSGWFQSVCFPSQNEKNPVKHGHKRSSLNIVKGLSQVLLIRGIGRQCWCFN